MCPPPGSGGEGHTRWQERGWESPNADEGTYTVALFYTFFVLLTLCYVQYACMLCHIQLHLIPCLSFNILMTSFVQGEIVVFCVADDSTRHIQEYNSKSKSKKRLPPVKRPVRRPMQMSTHWKPPPQQQQRSGQSGGGSGPRGTGGTPPRPYSRSGAPGGYRGPARPVFNGRGGGGQERLDGGGARYGHNMSQGPLREPKGGYGGGRSGGGARTAGGPGVGKHSGGGSGSGSSSRPGQVKSPPRNQQQQQQPARYRY